MYITEFHENGHWGPIDLLNDSITENLLAEFEICTKKYTYLGPESDDNYSINDYWKDLGSDVHWFKSLHLLMPSVRKLAYHPKLITLITQILGDNVILWGSQIIQKAPGDDHKWHVDVETFKWPSVNVWIGLENTNENASLKIISKSHTFNHTPQMLCDEEGLNLIDDGKIIKAALRLNNGAKLFVPNCKNGQAVFFYGKAWHGSFNQTNKLRTAILLQYSTPASKIQIPMTFTNPIIWHSFCPPCLMICGKDGYKLNSYIDL